MTSRPQVLEIVFSNSFETLIKEIPSMSWTMSAACASEDPDLFFTEEPDQVNRALAICNSCPMRELCLSAALYFEEAGIWGGTTEHQRASMSCKASNYRDLTEKEAASQLREIMHSPAEFVARKFDVQQRTVWRWRDGIKKNPQALRLAKLTH